MSLRVDDSKLFKRYCKIWKTIKGLLGIEFDSEEFMVILILM